MKFVVKNTTKCGVLDLLCPHSCRGCGRLGSVLCECCKKNLFRSRRAICPLCKRELGVESVGDIAGRCPDCELGRFSALYVGGWREGVLGRMVEEYKFQSVWALGEVLAEILDVILPASRDDGRWCGAAREEVVVVPLPTIGRHVRERGLDHTLRVARRVAKRRGWECARLLFRMADTVQVGSKATEREEQAQRAYAAREGLDAEKTYILLDDVWTTGASMRAAAEAMWLGGARKIVGLVVAVGRPSNKTADVQD